MEEVEEVEVEETTGELLEAVSYTHLDVYKRQKLNRENKINNEEVSFIDKNVACLLYTSRCV